MTLSIVIPTYRRERVLLQTVEHLLQLPTRPAEIILVDQTPVHEAETEQQLSTLHDERRIRWVRRAEPSITKAMNCGLQLAKSKLVLFLDDDIEPLTDLVSVHSSAHALHHQLWATVGQVVQPWQIPEKLHAPRVLRGLKRDFDFPFNSALDDDVENVMAGNLCVNRELALSIGGFDDNFVGAAFRFETEFARRVIKSGGQIRFLGTAGIRHLRVPTGGTRQAGHHLASASPEHGIGDHYFAHLHGNTIEACLYSLKRVFREVMTKFHLSRPWWIPVKLLGEIRAFWGGWRMAVRKKRGPR